MEPQIELSPQAMAPRMLRRAVTFFEMHRVEYRIVGSTASNIYGEIRFTNDIDILADIPSHCVKPLCFVFGPPEYYISEDSVRDAINQRGIFNILHPTTGMKIDIIIPKRDGFDTEQFQRGSQHLSDEQFSLWFASAEDVIIKKLEYYQLGQSEKHIRDIASMIKVQAERLDRQYILTWVTKLNLLDLWLHILDKVANPDPHNRV
jgi:hypothetical protein